MPGSGQFIDPGKLVPCPHANLADTSHLAAISGAGIQKTVGGRFRRQLLDGRKPLVDAGGRLAPGFESGAVSLDSGPGEGGTPLAGIAVRSAGEPKRRNRGAGIEEMPAWLGARYMALTSYASYAIL